MHNHTALEHYLSPLKPYLEQDGVTEICINEPQSVWVEAYGSFKKFKEPSLNLKHLEGLAQLVAALNQQFITKQTPVLSGVIPSGERIEIVMNPACETGKIIMSIRRQQVRDLTLKDYMQLGAFTPLNTNIKDLADPASNLKTLLINGEYWNFLEAAIKAKKNILISGGTGCGKTTFLNACLKAIDLNERIISIEDTREVTVPQANKVHLLAPKKGQGISEITVEGLFESCLRLRPDRIMLSEIRGAEVFAFLEAINSGHPGSLSTIHADSPNAAFEQLYRKMRRYGDKSPRAEAFEYMKSIIHVVVQLKRCPTPDRHMYVSEIYFNEDNNE